MNLLELLNQISFVPTVFATPPILCVYSAFAALVFSIIIWFISPVVYLLFNIKFFRSIKAPINPSFEVKRLLGVVVVFSLILGVFTVAFNRFLRGVFSLFIPAPHAICRHDIWQDFMYFLSEFKHKYIYKDFVEGLLMYLFFCLIMSLFICFFYIKKIQGIRKFTLYLFCLIITLILILIVYNVLDRFLY